LRQARDAPQKFDVLRRAVADTMPTIQSADAFEKYLDQSFAADATSASPASPAQPKKSGTLLDCFSRKFFPALQFIFLFIFLFSIVSLLWCHLITSIAYVL
jgi:hypothetical protein